MTERHAPETRLALKEPGEAEDELCVIERITIMRSHPNYRGYDATKGKPNKRHEPTKLMEHIGKLEAKDFPQRIEKGFLPKLIAIKEWCEHHDISFCPSPFPYQIAKLIHEDFTIVLWQSRTKNAKVPYIKPAWEGAHFGNQAESAMSKITELSKA